MVEIELTTENMKDINRYLNDYFNGQKAPKINSDILKLLKKVNIIMEAFEEIDAEQARIDEEE